MTIAKFFSLHATTNSRKTLRNSFDDRSKSANEKEKENISNYKAFWVKRKRNRVWRLL